MPQTRKHRRHAKSAQPLVEVTLPPATEVSVVMATSLEKTRTEAMVRAVKSVHSQTDCSVVPIIVVNGSRYDPGALEYWNGRNDVRVFQLQEGNYLNARLFGRRQVDTEFFGFLDDDDVYLQGAMCSRLHPMRTDASVDCVVGNGLVEREGHESVALSRLDLHRRDPLVGLAVENWMPSACAALFRTATVGVTYFEHPDRHLEWTCLAFRLAADGRRIVFLEDLTYRISDTIGSLSKGPAFACEAPNTLHRLLQVPMPHAAKRIWWRKYGATLHGLAEHHRFQGNIRLAWKAHLGSLWRPGGLTYALYTRHLLRRNRAP